MIAGGQVLNPDHLLEIAREGANSVAAGAPRQAVLRRAASTAYYAVFHALAYEISTTFVRTTDLKAWALMYRAINHGDARQRCERLAKSPMAARESRFFGFDEFPDRLRDFANAFVALQGLRHECDYNWEFKITKTQAMEAVDDAAAAIENLRAPEPKKMVFLTYLLHPLR